MAYCWINWRIICSQSYWSFDLKSNYELAFFIPLIAAMAGNVGVQSAAIIVQSIANNSLKMDY